MHILTITLHSNFFGRELDDQMLESIAREFYLEFQRLAVERKINDKIKVEAYWKKGCVVEYLKIGVEDPQLVFAVAGGATAAVIGATLKYKKLKENLTEISKDLKMFSKKIGGVSVSILASLISMTEPHPKARELSLVPIEKDDDLPKAP